MEVNGEKQPLIGAKTNHPLSRSRTGHWSEGGNSCFHHARVASIGAVSRLAQFSRSMASVKLMFAFRITIFFVAFLLFASICKAQQPSDPSEIYVESWTAGNKIREQVFKFNLDSIQNEHIAYARDVGIGYYKLILQNSPPNQKYFKYEYWIVQLKPVLSKPNRKEKLGCNLLTVEGCGAGDNFPKEDYVAILFPTVPPKNPLETIMFRRFYPINAKRVIKVRNFYLTIKVDNYKLNETNPEKLDFMEVTIELKNEYRPKNNCN